jgi:hypothetical protein
MWQPKDRMRIEPSDSRPKNALHQLYPHLSDAQLAEADETLRQYVSLALRVFERLEQDPEAMARFDALTASRRQLRMNGERARNQSIKR